jgi:hypothetical protein
MQMQYLKLKCIRNICYSIHVILYLCKLGEYKYLFAGKKDMRVGEYEKAILLFCCYYKNILIKKKLFSIFKGYYYFF